MIHTKHGANESELRDSRQKLRQKLEPDSKILQSHLVCEQQVWGLPIPEFASILAQSWLFLLA